MGEIVLFGATGYTGTLVADELYSKGLPFVLAGRDLEKLQRMASRLGDPPLRVADAQRPRSLEALMAGARVLINCAGPFTHYGEPVVNAAVESGVHYVDTTGEQAWMKRILNRYDGVALRNKTTVLNALAFEYAVGDWLAALAARQLGRSQPIDSISVGYSLAGEGWSHGTFLSAVEILGTQGWSYEGGRWRRRPVGWDSRSMPFPWGHRMVSWAPLGEALMVPRHERVQTVLTYMRLPDKASRLAPLVGKVAPLLHPLLRPLAERVVSQRPSGPSPEQRQRSRFAITAEARRAGEVVQLSGTGLDPYGLTARIAVLGAELLLNESVQRGVRAPAHLPLHPEEALARVGVAVEEFESP